MKRILSAVICCAVVLTSTMAQGGPRKGGGSEHPLLRKAMMAQKTLRYTGVRTLILRTGVEEQVSTESIWFDRGRMRIEYSGKSPNAGQVVVVADGKRFHYFPEANEIQVRKSRGEELFRLGELMRPGQKPAFSDTVGAKIAGRQTRLFQAADPRGNVMAKLWIDPETGMILKREMFDPTGRRVGAMEFTDFNLKTSFAPDDFRIIRKGAKIVTIEQSFEQTAKKLGLPNLQIPESTGFSLEMVRKVRLPEGKFALSAAYSRQGRSRVTLFILPENVDEKRLSLAKGGRLNSAMKQVGEVRVLLIGASPKSELEGLLAEIR